MRGQDLNLRPSGYEPDELPGCSTPRHEEDTALFWVFFFFLLFVFFKLASFKMTEFFEDCEDVSMPLADLAATYSPVP